MSEHRDTDSFDIPRPDVRDYYPTYLSATAIEREVTNTCGQIGQVLSAPKDAEDAFLIYVEQSRVLQLSRLSRYVLDMAIGRSFVTACCPANMNLIDLGDIEDDDKFPVSPNEKPKALAAGKLKGSQDLGPILAPVKITDPAERDSYLFPWRKDVAMRLFEQIESPDTSRQTTSEVMPTFPPKLIHYEDKSALLEFPTRLENIVVSNWYPPDDVQLPIQTIERRD